LPFFGLRRLAGQVESDAIRRPSPLERTTSASSSAIALEAIMRILALAFIPLLLLACGQEPAAVAPNGPEFNWMNNPDNGNVRISRYGTDWAISWTDLETGLRATHTTFPIGFGNPPQPELDCGPQEALDPVAEQDVGLADANDFLLSWFRSNSKGQLWIIVRDMNQTGDCYGVALVAEGIGSFHYTDNDIFGWYPEDGSIRTNNNAWGVMAQGKLTGVNGETIQYSGHYRITWDPQTPGGNTIVEDAQVVIH
jgi:hypothetical protein